MQLWEQLLLGAAGLLFLFFVLPGIKDTLERSKMADTDWGGFLLPIGVVVAGVIFVILLLRG